MPPFSAWLDDTGKLQGDPPPREHGGLRLLFRGFIANREELAAEAARRGEGLPHEPSDGLLLALAYRWWGADLQSRVTGEFSLVVACESRPRELLVTGDALGLMAPYVAETGPGQLVVSTHLEELVRRTGPGELDLEYVADYLFTGVHTGERTPYRHIRRLLPGRTLVVSDGRAREQETWSLASVPPLEASPAELEQRLRDRLREALAAASRAPGPVWVELSGGLDSSSVASAIRAWELAEIEAVSVVYRRTRSADETPWIQAVLARWPMPWHPLDGDETPPFSELPADFRALPGAYLDTPLLSRRYGELLGSHRVAVVLSGLGGDQTFLGDHPLPVHLADRLRRGRLWSLLAGLRAWQARDRTKRSLFHWLVECALRPAWRHALGRGLAGPGASAESRSPWLSAEGLGRGGALDAPRPSPWRWRSVGDRAFGEPVWLASRLASNRDHLARSFEFRHPLLYRPLVELLFAAPWEAKLAPGLDRGLQRRALAGILPEQIGARPSKAGIDRTLYEGLREHRAWVELLTGAPRIAARGWVDLGRWREAVDQARFGRVHNSSQFMAAATLEVWLRRLEDPGPGLLAQTQA